MSLRRSSHVLWCYRRVDGKYAWQLRATNGQIIATDGGQGYERFVDMVESIESVFRYKPRREDLVIRTQPLPTV